MQTLHHQQVDPLETIPHLVLLLPPVAAAAAAAVEVKDLQEGLEEVAVAVGLKTPQEL
jgi:hypothetical protein